MKKGYLKLKIKVTLLVIVILLLGSGMLTYQKADEIREEYTRLINEQTDFVLSVRMNDSYDASDMILRTYDAFSEVSRISDDIGFYSMLKDSKGNLLAEDQNFVLVKKIENGEFVDSRVILLGNERVSEDDSIQHVFAGKFFEKGEIHGTCDDIFIYLEELRWEHMISPEYGNYSYRPEKQESVQGAVPFEEWAGSNVFDQAVWEENKYCIFPCVAYPLYGDAQLSAKRNAEAKEICEQIYADFASSVDTRDYQRNEGIFTCYIGGPGYLNDEFVLPYAFVFHPVSIAMGELAGIYFLVLLFGIAIICFMWFAINKVQKQQVAYENNRRQLTRGIAHELKTPLAITKGYVENWENLEESNRPEYAKTMIEEINHMDRMVTDLLELSRLEAKAKELHVESVDVVALAQSVLKRMKEVIEEKGINVSLGEHMPEKEFLVEADLEMMRIVLVNFISNAVKYAHKEIVIDVSESGRKVKFTIMNDGQSIDKEKLDKVWDEFYKDDKRENSRLGSSGLGLAITKNILILHDAKYGCKSQDGKTVFWFEMKKNKG